MNNNLLNNTKKHIDEPERDIVPPIYRQPGLGRWRYSPNGYTHFLEIAIQQYKDAATRCADQNLVEEYDIFLMQAQELQEKLDALSSKKTNQNMDIKSGKV